jgi:two-component system OmpR family response regulator
MNDLYRILHVDDESDIREVVLIALEFIGGFEISQSDCGEHAIKAVKSFCPQLLLMDVMMPSMSGPDTFRSVIRMPGFEKTPGIFMSAKGPVFDIPDDIADNVLGIIPKPFDPASLSEEILAFWNYQ